MYCNYTVTSMTDDSVDVMTRCPNDGNENIVTMSRDRYEEYSRAVEDPMHARKIQEIFPDTEYTAEQREYILSGYCHDCQERIFGRPWDEEDEPEESDDSNDQATEKIDELPASTHKPKMTPFDTTMDLMIKMSEGNPGALMTCTELLKLGTSGVVAIIFLDYLGIYGERLYMLWNDCCDRDIQRVMKVVSAVNAEKKLSEEDVRKHVSGVRGTPFTDEELGIGKEDR